MWCYLCNQKGDHVTFHRFPKQLHTKRAWLAFCKLNETTDDVSNTFLCSEHFLPADYEPIAKQMGNNLRLKSDSIPSILKPRPSTSKSPSIKYVGTRDVTKLDAHKPTDPLEDLLNTETTQIPSCSTQYEDETFKMRLLFIPRYISDIKSEHFINPRQAKVCLDFAKRKCCALQRKIKMLKQKVRRQNKIIRYLEASIVNHLNDLL